MAVFIRSWGLLTNSTRNFQNYSSFITRNLMRRQLLGFRNLYQAAALGVDGYEENRAKTLIQYSGTLKDKFCERMNTLLENEKPGSMIFTEDLKNAIHLANPTDEDLSLIVKMAEKFNNQHGGLRFGTYIFGPVFLRMCHHLNQPDAALQAFRSEELNGFFDQVASCHILMDLLYKNERYEDCLSVFSEIQEKRIGGVKYIKTCLTLAVASCYKMNTQESFEKMMKTLEDAKEFGTTINLRTHAFAAALSLLQNNPHIALEIISQLHKHNHPIIRNIKVLALSELGRIEDTLPILRSSLQIDLPEMQLSSESAKFTQVTIARVKEFIAVTESKELDKEFQHIFKGLESNNLISEKTLDDLLCEPIRQLFGKNKKQDRAILAASFNRNTRNQKYRPRQDRRPGLMDLE